MALDALEAGRRRIQIVMPQGSGKTRVAKELLWKLLSSGRAHRALCLTTRRVMAEQLAAELRDVASRFEVIVLPDPRGVERSPVHVATTAYFLLPTRVRLDTLSPATYDLVIVLDLLDQAKSLHDVIEHFPDAWVIGFSGRAHLAESFGAPVFQLTIEDAMAAETIATPVGFRAVSLGDVASVSIGSTGDRDGSEWPLITARSLPTDGSWPAAVDTRESISSGDAAIPGSPKVVVAQPRATNMLKAS